MYALTAKEKLNIIIEKSWEVFISQFINGRLIVTKEAPFQHCLANILKQTGDLHCFSRKEQFYVDLEAKEENILGKNKYLDITCSLYDKGLITAKAAIELKFKKKSQGADDEARIDAYVDIQSLEQCVLNKNYDVGYFFMITDLLAYTKLSKKLDSTAFQFSMCNGYSIPLNVDIIPKLRSRSNLKIKLLNPYTFLWDEHHDFYFLKLKI